MKALVLEKKMKLVIQDLEIYQKCDSDEVRIAIKNVGICGSDVHYYQYGGIGAYIVKEPMVLGHEASGVIVETGRNVTGLKVGDRVCMEPGIPDSKSSVSRRGLYNLDPSVQFWATPPVQGCLCESVVHPADFTYKITDKISYAEGAMIEPLAIGLQAAEKGHIKPGDVALVTGCGTIGLLTALSALAGGCSRVYISDINSQKLGIASQYNNIIPINASDENLFDRIMNETEGNGVDCIFEASGSPVVFPTLHEYAAPGGVIVLVGIPVDGFGQFSISGIQSKELRLESVFRSAHKYKRAIRLIDSGNIDVKPLISAVYDFDESLAAYEAASDNKSHFIKIQIQLGS
ncbi:NAD(P)-dependent alcohol dehydrogenase [Oceanispirochaeta sp.]|uniref:NAD(P)-dependent alcohol dehydrogenase n=1 Tax=Oceanispirochaeta sp. TaxID=2035350 RepID=UPI00261F2633|nr:NAD(P)-dependent alcohol dehydrogenase [Oceanispirochaeta sp.]MDA3957372.1 NAD(P)-dependent alcohol dehydrogenase [Oceanispirochaeta sp.]